MNQYTFTFEGKLIGAIGAFQGFTKSVFADDLEKAILKLYDAHEHIFKLFYWDGRQYVKYMSMGKDSARNI